VQERTKKGTYMLIKEIQAFQNYFETAYRPVDLSGNSENEYSKNPFVRSS
jgi:hypothetical protein